MHELIRTNRAEYLADHPDERRVETAIAVRFNQKESEFREIVADIGDLKIRAINKARAAGEMLKEEADLLPGGQLTLDFWKQISGTGKHQFHGDFASAQKFLWIANHLARDIKTLDEAREVQVALKFFLDEKIERPDQHRIGAQDEWGCLLAWFDKFEPERILETFQSNPLYFEHGKLREEFRDYVMVKLKPKLDAVHQLEKLLGL